MSTSFGYKKRDRNLFTFLDEEFARPLQIFPPDWERCDLNLRKLLYREIVYAQTFWNYHEQCRKKIHFALKEIKRTEHHDRGLIVVVWIRHTPWGLFYPVATWNNLKSPESYWFYLNNGLRAPEHLRPPAGDE